MSKVTKTSAVLELLNSNTAMTDKDIAAQVGCAVSTVKKQRVLADVAKAAASAELNLDNNVVADVVVEDVVAPVSKLGAMVAAAADAKVVEDAKVEDAAAPAATAKKKRVSKYTEARDTAKRDVVVILSEEKKLAYIATNVQYTALKDTNLLPMLTLAVEARAKFAGIASATDKTAYVANSVAHSLEQDAKAKEHDKLVDAGYTVLSTRGKGVPARVVEESTENETITETA